MSSGSEVTGSTITRVVGEARWEAAYGYCRVVVAGGWAVTAGTTATGPEGVLHPGEPYLQARAAFGIALDALAGVGVGPDRVVRTRMHVTDMADSDEFGRAHRELFAATPPVATMVQVSGLADPAHLIEVELEAWVGSGG